MSQDPSNPQINVSKIPGGGGIAGTLFAVISMTIFLIGIPALRYFLPAAILLGCAVAFIVRRVRRQTPGSPWILAATENPSEPQPQRAIDAKDRPTDVRRRSPLFA
jgi:hypothetical protein